MGAADVVPVAVRRQNPTHVLDGDAGMSQRRLNGAFRRGRDAGVNQRRLGRIDVVDIDNTTRLPEWTRDGHNTRLCRHGRYVNVPLHGRDRASCLYLVYPPGRSLPAPCAARG